MYPIAQDSPSPAQASQLNMGSFDFAAVLPHLVCSKVFTEGKKGQAFKLRLLHAHVPQDLSFHINLIVQSSNEFLHVEFAKNFQYFFCFSLQKQMLEHYL